MGWWKDLWIHVMQLQHLVQSIYQFVKTQCMVFQMMKAPASGLIDQIPDTYGITPRISNLGYMDP